MSETKAPAVRLALRALRRDWRSGELRALLAALVVSVAAVASVGFFTDRIRLAMDRQAGELIAADIRVASSNPIPAHVEDEARRFGLQTARMLRFRTVVFAAGKTQLVELKATGPGYPLRGTLRVADEPYGAETAVDQGPAPGTVWAEPRLLNALGIGVGDEVAVGVRTFRLERVIAYEPDRGGQLFSIAPRLMINMSDIPSTDLIRPGSRVRYRLLIAGDVPTVEAFKAVAGGLLAPGERLQSARDGRPELRAALDRSQRFLGLAALVSVILAGVAIALSARRFASRHWDAVAIMRCFGATQGTVLRLYVIELLALGVVAGVIGVAAGYVAQEALTRILGQIVPGTLPWPSLMPALPALATGLVALTGFALPPILRLRQVPPIRVLRRDLGAVRPVSAGAYGLAALLLVALVAWQARDVTLAAWVVGGTAATFVVLSVAAWVMVRLLGRLRGRVGVAWRFGLANIARRGAGTVVQVVALGLGIMALLTLTLVRGQLLEEWEASIPPGAPNHFLINIRAADIQSLEAFLQEQGASTAGLYPMIRGRLVSIDARPVAPPSSD